MMTEEQIVAHPNSEANKSSKNHKKPSTNSSKKKDNSSATKKRSTGPLKSGYVKKDFVDESIQKNEAKDSSQPDKVNVCLKRKSRASITLANAKPKKKSVTPHKVIKTNEVTRSMCKDAPQEVLSVPTEADDTSLQCNNDDAYGKLTVYDIPDGKNKNGINTKEHVSEEDQLEDFDVLSQYSCMTDIDTSQDVDVSGYPLNDWTEEAFAECLNENTNVETTKTLHNQSETKISSGLSPVMDSCCNNNMKKTPSQIDLTNSDEKALHYITDDSLHQDVGCLLEDMPLESNTRDNNTPNCTTYSVSSKVHEVEHFKIPKRIRPSNTPTDITLDPQSNEDTNKDSSMTSKSLVSDNEKTFVVNTLQRNKKRKATKETLSRGVPKKQKKPDSSAVSLECSGAMESLRDTGSIEKDALLALGTQSCGMKNEVFIQNIKENINGPSLTQDDVICVSMPMCDRDSDTASSNVVSKNIEENTTMDITMSQGETQEETINTVIEPTTQNMNGTVDPNLELSRDSTFHQSRVTDPIKMAGSLLNTEAITKTKLGVPKQKKRSKHSRKTKDSEDVSILPDGMRDGLSLRIQLPNRCDVEKNHLTKKLTWGELKNSWPSIIQWKHTMPDKPLDTEVKTTLAEASTVTCNVSLSVKPTVQESELFEKDIHARPSTIESKSFDNVLVTFLQDLKKRLLLNLPTTDKTSISTSLCDELTISVQCDLPYFPSLLQSAHLQETSLFLQRLNESIRTMGYKKQEYQGIQNNCTTDSKLPLLWSQSSTHSTHFVSPYCLLYSKIVFLLSPSALSEDCFKDQLFSLTCQFCSRKKTEFHALNFDTSTLRSLRNKWKKNQLPKFFSNFFDSHSKPVFWIPKKGKTLLNISSLPSPPYMNMSSTEMVRVMKETVSFVIRNSTTQMGYVSFPALAFHSVQIVSNENSQIPNTLEFNGFYPQKIWLWVRRQEEKNQPHTATKISLLEKLRLDSDKSATVST